MTYFLNLFLSWNILFSPSMVNASFAGYSSLGLHPWSLSVCSTSIQDLQAFMVSTEKSGVILIGLPLYVTWPFSFAALKILPLFCMFCVLIIIWKFFLVCPLFGPLSTGSGCVWGYQGPHRQKINSVLLSFLSFHRFYMDLVHHAGAPICCMELLVCPSTQQ